MSEFEAAKPSMNTPFVVLAGDKVIYSNLIEINEEDLPTGVVDLGLPSGLKWASCSIGADKPCDSGLLFQFGRVDGCAYDDANHQFSSTNPPITTSGKTYGADDVLSPDDDAAYQATNGKLRMPTVTEIDELLSDITNEWCQCKVLGEDHTTHTVYGRLFTSKADESKKIFIPAVGYFDGRNGTFNSACSDGYEWSAGYVWSASVNSSGANYAYHLCFGSDYCYCNSNDRSNGYSVRGVQD